MDKSQLINRYTELAHRRSELLLSSPWDPDVERQDRILCQELSALEIALRASAEETAHVPTMLGLREAAEQTGLSYDYIRKLCLQGEITYIRAGSRFLINMEKLIEYLNNPGQGRRKEARIAK